MYRVLGFLVLFWSGVLLADQEDPQLEDLFAELKQETDVFRANSIANRIWDIWVRHEDPQAAGLMQRGISQMNANDLYSARETYTRLIAMKPDFAEAWNKRATIYWMLGDYDASLKDIEEVLKLEPWHFGALSGRGLVYMDRGDYFLARGAFLTLLEVYPAMPGVKDTIMQLEQVLRDSAV
jgi:tetratricopeptide (TPR) repeat protein